MSETGNKRSHRQNRKRNRRIRAIQAVLKAFLALIVVVAAIAAVIVVVRKSNEEKVTPVAVTETTSVEETEAAASVLEKDAVPEINDLVNKYFTAIHNCDMDALSTLVASTASVSEEQLQTEATYVESYQDIVCYSAKGVVDGSYIVYVSYNLKLINITTPAPCMIRLYICTNADGSLYIYNETTVDDATAEYMDQLNSSAEVTALLKTVDDALTTARANDADLNNFVALLNGDTTEETTAVASAEIDGGEFTDVDETVYAKSTVNIRAEASMDSEVVATLNGGDSIHRTGYNDNWSRVEFDGQTRYISAGYLTSQDPSAETKESAESVESAAADASDDGFTVVDETVYAKESVRIRKSTSTDSEEIGYLLVGDSCKRTGYNDGWSRVEYEGKVGYIAAGYLTTYPPESESESAEN